MKASLKVLTTQRKSKKGFPIYLEIICKHQRKRKCIAHTFLKDWDQEGNLPLLTHPDYNVLMPLVLGYKAKISKVLLGDYSFTSAENYLFGSLRIIDNDFKSMCAKYCNDSTTGKLYQTVLNNFDLHFPGVLVSDITPKMVQQYMRDELEARSPNGVHTYLRTLNALFNKVSDLPNPFKGMRPKKVRTKQKNLTDTDLKKLINTRTFKNKFDGHNTNDSVNYYRYYWLLMFYLGGIDCVDLAALRYDKHVVDGRIQFYRNKGGTNTFVNNKIFKPAKELLAQFNCYPYLVPIYKYKNQNDFVSNMNERLYERVKDLKLSNKPLTKASRYTFINRARQLEINERITIEIVGHEQQSTHSIYTDEYPLKVRDAAHEKIISVI